MKALRRAAITSVGHYVPPDIYDNAYFESYLDTSDQWIRERTGIQERRVLKEGGTSELAVPAIKLCLERRGIGAEEIDCIVMATVTPDMLFPSTASIIQGKIGAKKAWGFDLEAACSSFLYALSVGTRLVESGAHDKVLVVGADKMTAISDYQDRNTCILFGDGGGAVLLEAIEDESLGLIDFSLKTDPSGGCNLYMAAGGSLLPPSHETVDKRQHFIYQDGKTVFKAAVPGMADAAETIMRRNDLTADEWEAIVEAWGACAYCGLTIGPFQRDCVLPISRGGRYTFENVVPACRSCNASKSNDEVTGWLRRKRLDERAFLLRHVEILRAWRS